MMAKVVIFGLCSIPVVFAPIETMGWWWFGMSIIGAIICEIFGVEL